MGATQQSGGNPTMGGDLSGTASNAQIVAGAVGAAEISASIKDAAAGTPSLRTLGTGAAQALPGNTPVGGGGSASRVNATAYGAAGDGVEIVYVKGAANGTTLVASSGTPFLAAMVGKGVQVAGAGAHGAPAVGTITAVSGSSNVQATVNITSGGNGSGGFLADFTNGIALVGTDNGPALAAIFADAATRKGVVVDFDVPSPWGFYLFFTEPGQVSVDGLVLNAVGGRGFVAGGAPYNGVSRQSGVMWASAMNIRILDFIGSGHAGPIIQNITAYNPGAYKGTRGPDFIHTKGANHMVIRDCAAGNMRRGIVFDTQSGFDTSWTRVENFHSRGNGKGVEVDNSVAVLGGGAQGASNITVLDGDYQVYDGDTGVQWATGYGRIGLFKVAIHGPQEWTAAQRYMLGTKLQPAASNGHMYEVVGVPAFSASNSTADVDPGDGSFWKTDGTTATTPRGYVLQDLGLSTYWNSTFGLSVKGLVGVGGEASHLVVLPITIERSGHSTQPLPGSITLGFDAPTGSVTVIAPEEGGGGGAEVLTGSVLSVRGNASQLVQGFKVIGGALNRGGWGARVEAYVDHALFHGIDMGLNNPGGVDQPIYVDALATRTRIIDCVGDSPTDVSIDPNDHGNQTEVVGWTYYSSGATNQGMDRWRITSGTPPTAWGGRGSFAFDPTTGTLYVKQDDAGPWLPVGGGVVEQDIPLGIAGGLAGIAGAQAADAWVPLGQDLTLRRMVVACKTAPAAAMVVQLRRSQDSGVTWSNVGGFLVTFTAGGEFVQAVDPADIDMSAGDLLGVDLSGTQGGADLRVAVTAVPR